MTSEPTIDFSQFVRDTASPVARIAGHTALAALAQIHPVTAALYAGCSVGLAMMGKERRRVFADAFGVRKPTPPPEALRTESFARAAYVTIDAASKTASEEKVRGFAYLLRNALEEGALDELDQYREYVQIVDDLSPVEFQILAALREQLERLPPKAGLFGMPVPEDLTTELKDKKDLVSADLVRWERAKKTLRAPFNTLTMTGEHTKHASPTPL